MSGRTGFETIVCHASRRRGRDRRRGIAVILLLGLLSMALALSYSLLRSQATTSRVASNGDRRQLARQAARTGISTALAKLHDGSWGGVTTTLSASLSSYESYTVTFAAGDPRLSASSPDYADWPMRLTVLSTGTSVDPTNASLSTTHQVRVILRLVPRALSSAISGWTSMTNYTFYQTDTDSCSMQMPCQVQGAVRLQGALSLASSYPSTTSSRARYLDDLRRMQQANVAEYRPLTGQISLPFSQTDSTTRGLMTTQLGLTLVDIAQSAAQDTTISTSASTYRLYSGGPSYTMQSVGSSLTGTTLSPNPQTNPLGIFYRSGSITLGNNVTITGTLLASGDVSIDGDNVNILHATAPALQGTTQTVRLPAIIANSVTASWTSDGLIRGNVVCWNEFRATAGFQGLGLTIEGRLVADRFRHDSRWEWTLYSWLSLYTSFTAQESGGQTYFPLWLSTVNLYCAPGLVVRPSTAGYREHYQPFTSPLYTTASGDSGLYWDLLLWTDNP